ncbi:MAG: response regulator [Opitutaceae bacterium]|nr:response regulator [Opitutaceae bacterium]
MPVLPAQYPPKPDPHAGCRVCAPRRAHGPYILLGWMAALATTAACTAPEIPAATPSPPGMALLEGPPGVTPVLGLLALLVAGLATVLTRLVRAERAARRAEATRTTLEQERDTLRDDLLALEHRMRRTFTRAGLGTWRWAPGQREIGFCPRARALFGIDKSETAETSPMAMIEPADIASIQLGLAALRPDSTRFQAEIRVRRSDGMIRWFEMQGESSHDETGRLIQVEGHIQDVSQHRRSARAIVDANAELERRVAVRTTELETANSRLRAVLNAATTFAVIATDLRGRIILFNPGAERILGYAASEVVDALPLTALYAPAELAARSRELAAQLGRACQGFRILTHFARQGESEEREWTFVRKDRSHVLVSVSMTAVRDARGVATGFLGIARSITEHRAMEERLRLQSAALEAADHGVLITDASGAICWANPAFTRLTGHDRQAVIGASPRVLSSGFHPPQFYREMWDTILAGRVWHGEVLNRRRDGTTYFEEMTITPVHNTRGRISHFVAIKQDVTERRRSEMRLREAMNAAEAGARAKSEFLAVMSHEIRTPMNGVIGLTQLLLDTGLNPAQMRYAETIQTCADSLLTIINQILDFSKIEAGKLELETLDFDLRTVVEDTLAIVASRAHAKQLEIAAEFGPGVPRWVRGDPGRIRQVLTNLVGNAIKFTEAGEVLVKVSVGQLCDRQVDVAFSISDTGVGIPPEVLPRLFSAFSQADTSTTRRYGGTGLGLAIARQLVELMGGTIRATSEPGRGSTFDFTVRLEWEPLPATTPSEIQNSLLGTAVLVVDDNATQRRILGDMLASWRMQTAFAGSADEALARLREAAAQGRPLAIALLDATMPGTDGLELARQIAADAALAACATILLSPLDRIMQEETLRAARVHACVAKPVKESRLFDAIATTLAGGDQAAASLARSYRRLPARTLAPAGNHSRPNRLRILFAEDNAVNQLVGLDQLSTLGYQADVVADGAAAIEALSTRTYDVVLMDCMMPQLDGLEATRRIRDLERRRAPGFDRPTPLRIIALTANAQPGDRETCLAAGMDDYIAKPVRTQDLRHALEHYEAALGAAPRDPTAGPARAAPAADALADDGRVEPVVLPPSDPIDRDRLDQVFAFGPERAARLVRSYLEGAESMKEQLAAALVRQIPGEVRTLAHRWAGSSSTCGLVALAEALRDLENLARGGSLAGAEKFYARIAECHDETRPILESRLAGKPGLGTAPAPGSPVRLVSSPSPHPSSQPASLS